MDAVDYVNTFITVAPDAAAEHAIVPPAKSTPTVAARTLELIAETPYARTSGDVIFTVWAERQEIPESDRQRAREEFYATSRACLRSSDLGKRYGWGLHSDAEGRLAAYAVDSSEYAAFAGGTNPNDGTPVVVTSAMRSTRR